MWSEPNMNIPFVDCRYYDQNIDSNIRLLKWIRKTKSDENLYTLGCLELIGIGVKLEGENGRTRSICAV